MFSLKHLNLDALEMNIKDALKLIHCLDNLHRLAFYQCLVFGRPKNAKVNTKARFELKSLVFDQCSTIFELKELANILLQNDSLKQQL